MQQALSMPEIVAGVIEQLVDDDSLDRAELLANLFSCALVNRTWSTEAISALWSYPTDPWSSQHPGHLPWYFASLEASRRQTYATLVYEADLSTDDLLANYNYAVAGLAFPNLHRIRIQVAETLHPKLPQMDGHHVRCLQIDPEVDAPGIFALDEDGLDELLDRIASLFPLLEAVTFQDACIANHGSIPRFASRLPSLSHLDDKYVITNESKKWTHLQPGGSKTPWRNND